MCCCLLFVRFGVVCWLRCVACCLLCVVDDALCVVVGRSLRVVVCCWLFVGALSLFVVRGSLSDVRCLPCAVCCGWLEFAVYSSSCDG